MMGTGLIRSHSHALIQKDLHSNNEDSEPCYTLERVHAITRWA